MSARDGKPCKRCGSNEWYASGDCAPCKRAGNLRWQKANREKKSEYDRQWRQDNPEKFSEYVRQWRQDNPEKVVASVRRWQKANPEKCVTYSLRWKRANPEKVAVMYNRYRTAKTQAGGSFTTAEWKALCDHYGNRCLCCGRDDVKLTVDHIVPVSKGGSSNIDNLQPLCQSCNTSKFDKEIDYRPSKGFGRWIQKKLFG